MQQGSIGGSPQNLSVIHVNIFASGQCGDGRDIISAMTRKLLVLIALLAGFPAVGQDLSDVAKIYRPRLESNLVQSIAGFWYPKTVDEKNGGYILNHDIDGKLKPDAPRKMIVTQARMLWLFSHLAREGYGKEYLGAADFGFRFLRDKMWDQKNGGFYWEVDVTGDDKLLRNKHMYGQAFALYALSEYYLASGKQEALDLANQLFNVLEAKAHDAAFGGYNEWFSEDWSPGPDGNTYMGEPDHKLMNTHLHILEALTTYYRASKLPLARERLLELIEIQSETVVRKNLGACTDKYARNWEPDLNDGYARVSYGHDLENVWLLNDACDAAGISNYPLLDTYKSLYNYSVRYGFDVAQGGFFYTGPFNQPAADRSKSWWVQAEACVSSLYMYRLTHDARDLEIFEKTYDWIDQHQVDWKNGEWFEMIHPDRSPSGDKAQIWKGGYHNGRAMMQCLDILKAAEK
jgi:mannobiose 2-epimerase